jgi:hypothetical protein
VLVSHHLQGADIKNSLKHTAIIFLDIIINICLSEWGEFETEMVIKIKRTLFVCVCAHAHAALISVDGF